VVNLGVAGMLHDIGKTKLPAALRGASAVALPATEADRAAWETHSQLGYEMIKGGLEPSASAAVLHHHQHFDGTGFPAIQMRDGAKTHASGESIHIFARILHLADLFEHLTARPAGRRTNVEILHLLRSKFGQSLDPRLLIELPKIIPPFPPGSKVRLSDGRDAVVTAIDPEDPYHPTVKRLVPPGKAVEPEPLHLGLSTGLRVAQIGNLQVDPLLPPLMAA
jgi:HD-GYP domain-containing protein (c-di-GMP phosphodiesterase class II)